MPLRKVKVPAVSFTGIGAPRLLDPVEAALHPDPDRRLAKIDGRLAVELW